MSLTSRRQRPIPRDAGKLRDTRLFVLATEDTYAPKQYFSFFRHPRIHVKVLETTDGISNPGAIVNRLISYAEEYQVGGDDQLWVLLDTDHWISGSHKAGLIKAIKAASERGYRVAMSNPCFDLWLLLHHEDIARGANFPNCNVVGERIKALKGEFNKTNLKEHHYEIGSAELAFIRAQALELELERAAADYWPETIGTRVWLLIHELKNAGLFPSSL